MTAPYTTAPIATGDESLTPDDAVDVLEEILEAQNQSRFLGLKLKVPEYIVTSIHTRNMDPKDCLYYILVEFLKQVEPKPTWRIIVAALRSPIVNLPQLAMKVEVAHFPATHDTPRETTTSTPRETTTSTGKSTTTVEVVRQEICGLQDKFNKLKMETIQCLESFRISVTCVVDTLTSLRADGKGKCKMFPEEFCNALMKSQDHHELFESLNLYWNYLAYHLLDHLIVELSQNHRYLTDVNEQPLTDYEIQRMEQMFKDIKGKMESYKTDLKQFSRGTTLRLFCEAQEEKIDDPPPTFRKIVCEHNWSVRVSNAKLEDVEKFCQHYLRHYNLRDCAMMLNSIRPGTFTVTWFVTSSVFELLKKKEPTKVLNEFDVSRMELAGSMHRFKLRSTATTDQFTFFSPESVCRHNYLIIISFISFTAVLLFIFLINILS